jgi:hypothetical protein
MNFFLKFFGGGDGNASDDPRLNKRYTVNVEGQQVPALYADANEHPTTVLDLLDIRQRPRPAIFITGGAGKMSDEDKQLTREIFEQGVAPFAEEHQIVVIDGATKSGVIEMMATARLKGKFSFPLVGIAPLKNIVYPGRDNPEGHPLCPGHSHFVFVTGDEYGAESKMIIDMAHVLAGGKLGVAARPVVSVGIVINGGQITRQEAYMATTKTLNIPLVVMEGSGRFSDDLANAWRTGETSQSLLRSIINRGNIELVATTGGPEAMREALNKAFRAPRS